MRGAFSVVIDGGYSLGIACRIDPSLQAIGNSDSGKLAVNRRCGLITAEFASLCHTVQNCVQDFEPETGKSGHPMA